MVDHIKNVTARYRSGVQINNPQYIQTRSIYKSKYKGSSHNRRGRVHTIISITNSTDQKLFGDSSQLLAEFLGRPLVRGFRNPLLTGQLTGNDSWSTNPVDRTTLPIGYELALSL